MSLIFRLIEIINGVYRYAYALDEIELDGIIEYRSGSKEIVITKPCKNDEGDEQGAEWSQKIFKSHIVNFNFPKMKTICTG